MKNGKTTYFSYEYSSSPSPSSSCFQAFRLRGPFCSKYYNPGVSYVCPGFFRRPGRYLVRAFGFLGLSILWTCCMLTYEDIPTIPWRLWNNITCLIIIILTMPRILESTTIVRETISGTCTVIKIKKLNKTFIRLPTLPSTPKRTFPVTKANRAQFSQRAQHIEHSNNVYHVNLPTKKGSNEPNYLSHSLSHTHTHTHTHTQNPALIYGRLFYAFSL